MDNGRISQELTRIARLLTAKRREGYLMSMTYERWSQEDIEAGDTDDRGWEYEDEHYRTLNELLKDTPVRQQSWLQWSSTSPRPQTDWVISEPEKDHRSGTETTYNLFIKRADKQPMDKRDLKIINKALGVR